MTFYDYDTWISQCLPLIWNKYMQIPLKVKLQGDAQASQQVELDLAGE